MLIKKEGFSFAFNPGACKECNAKCCQGASGYVWVSISEIEEIASFLNMEVENFAKIYLKRVKNRYSLREIKVDIDNYACIFLDRDNNLCKIYEVRPKQCRVFPMWEEFRENFDWVKEECPGVVEIKKDKV